MPNDAEHRDISEQPSDDALIARANAGDAAAFEVLYLRYRGWVMHLALRFTHGDRDLALDVTQDTFLQLLRKFPGFTLTAQLKTYLYPVVRHTALAMARQRHLAPPTSDPSATAEPTAADLSGGDLAALRSAIDALDPGQREVVLLRFADDLSLQEIALAMEIPLGTVKSRLHNALAELRQNDHLRDFFGQG